MLHPKDGVIVRRGKNSNAGRRPCEFEAKVRVICYKPWDAKSCREPWEARILP